LSRQVSPSTNRVYGVARVSQEFLIPRSTYYDFKAARSSTAPTLPKKRGPKTKLGDAELTDEIRAVLDGSPFTGEGHRKAWARLRMKGIRRARRVLGPRSHEGTIVTDRPDEMWGTDATSTYTVENGHVTVFAAIDHATSECVGIHVAKHGSRFEALEPLRQGVHARFGTYAAGVARGLTLRHDNGPQYISGAFQGELRFLGIDSSPSFVRAPEGNGVAERFFRTLKEQLLWINSFLNLEELRRALAEWVKVYNEKWLVARHGYRSPAQVRRDYIASLNVAV
jgi:transposase InsO family protein